MRWRSRLDFDLDLLMESFLLDWRMEAETSCTFFLELCLWPGCLDDRLLLLFEDILFSLFGEKESSL